MAVKTPKEWEQMECVKTTTAYGNEVMIPKQLIRDWEHLRARWNSIKAEAGIDISTMVSSLPISMSLSPPTKKMLMVFFEQYQEP